MISGMAESIASLSSYWQGCADIQKVGEHPAVQVAGLSPLMFNGEDPHKIDRYYPPHIHCPPVPIWQFTNFLVTGPGLLVSPEKVFLTGYDIIPEANVHDLIYRRAKEGATLDIRSDDVFRQAGRSLLMATSGITNFYHAMIDVLPRLMQVRDQKIEIDQILWPAWGPDYLKALIEQVAPDIPVITYEASQYISCETLILPGKLARPKSVSPLVATYLREIAAMLCGEGNAQVWPDKIFTLRREVARERRQLLNLTEARMMLRDHGFQEVFPGAMSLPDQIRMFSACQHLISPIGAMNANIPFMPTNSKLALLYNGHDTEYPIPIHLATTSAIQSSCIYGTAFENDRRGDTLDTIINTPMLGKYLADHA